MQDEPKLVQGRTMICATPNPLQTQAQYMTEQKVSLPDRDIIGKIIPITHVGRRETLRSEAVRKENSTYIVSICRPPSKPPDKQKSRRWDQQENSTLHKSNIQAPSQAS